MVFQMNLTSQPQASDNGFTWKYHTELDPADGGVASNDDTAIVIGMGDLGTSVCLLKADYLLS